MSMLQASGATLPRPNTAEDARNEWRKIIESFYPDILSHTYCVPPIHFNRVNDETTDVGGWPVSIRKPPNSASSCPNTSRTSQLPSTEPRSQSSNALGNIQADFAQQHVLTNLTQLGRENGETMFILSELNFKDYLNKPFYAKATAKLPKPANLPKQDRHLGKQGDFDVLLIHRKHGILVGEVKSVGRSEAGRADGDVARVLDKAVKQLDKCEAVVRHLLSDIAPRVSVRKTLFLPYVSSGQLRRLLSATPKLKKVS